jgi:hypothetical protein
MGARTSVLPDLLSQASPATPPRHDRSTSEEVRIHNFILQSLQNHKNFNFDKVEKKKKIGLVF